MKREILMRRRYPAILLGLLLALLAMGLGGRTLAAQPTPAGPETLVSGAANDSVPCPRLGVAANGSFEIAWEHPGNPLVIDTKSVLPAYLGGNPSEVPSNYTAASPTRLVTSSSPPTLLLHGGRDELVSVYQSERLAQRLAQEQRAIP